MRLILDTLAALMLIAILGGVMYHNRSTALLDERTERTRLDVVRFQQQIMLQSALTDAGPGEQTHPETIDPAWFDGDLPVNSLLDADRPWVEVAPAKHWDRLHPLNRTATDSSTASFWYKPAPWHCAGAGAG